MTNEQKTKIISLRKQGNSLAEIASKLGLPIGTVKSFCSRNHPVAETALDVESLPSQPSAEGAKCKKCGAPLNRGRTIVRSSSAPISVAFPGGMIIGIWRKGQRKKPARCVDRPSQLARRENTVATAAISKRSMPRLL